MPLPAVLAFDLSGIGDMVGKALPGGIVGVTLVLIVWLVTFAVTTLTRGDEEDARGSRHPPRR